MNNGNAIMYKKALILAAIALPLLLLLGWIYEHAFITISVPKDTGKYSYELSDPTGKKIVGSPTTASTKKLVKRGQYQLTIWSGNKGYTTVFKTGSFLQNKAVAATLITQQQRTFVGDNPAPCMQMVADRLISMQCGGSFADAMVHVPGNKTAPGYTDQIDLSKFYGELEGIVTTPKGAYVISRAVFTDSDSAGHFAQPISANFTIGQSIELANLNPNSSYKILGYKDGFIAYDSAGQDIWYFASPSTKPQKISMAKDTASLPLLSIKSFGTSLTATYGSTESDAETETKDDSQNNVRGTTKIAIYDGSTAKEYDFKNALNDAQSCGNNIVCVIQGKRFQVYSVADGKPILQYTLPGVSSMHASGNSLLLEQGDSVLEWDTSKQSGHLAYKTEGYQTCGMSDAVNGVLLCVIRDNIKSALLIDATKSDTDTIDLKISQLKKELKSMNISIYRNYIYFGFDLLSLETTYNPTLKIYEPSRAKLTEIQNTVTAAVKKQNINTNVFTVVNLTQ